MKALSIKQPWAWLIVSGHKDVENRSWWTSFRGPVLIHAGKQHDGPKGDWGWPDIARPDALDYGGIIGIAEIVNCVRLHNSPWFCGPHGFVVRGARRLPFVPLKGQLGFFDVPADVVRELGL
ncbi:ASCH domain-containing protein [Gluconacetobacter sp. Hr-1-5]|uniref:ASCH domain-containing protein n=1 Tax=Gluconacetobacter sp. Hr-1-5 TaxID=3395370 RepID=UPI003B52A1CE